MGGGKIVKGVFGTVWGRRARRVEGEKWAREGRDRDALLNYRTDPFTDLSREYSRLETA